MTPPTLSHPPTRPTQPIAPEMPRIPGVKQAAPRAPFQLKPFLAIILPAVFLASVFALWLSHRRHTDLHPVPGEAAPFNASGSKAGPTAKTATEPNAIGTLYELAAPWSSKAFFFVDPRTGQGVPAMVIHLPGPPAEPSFWAFALTNPLSRCQLQYVTDLAALSRRFAYSASHPMVVSDCEGALYDPLKMATLPDGTWVRGEIVSGTGIRPPVAIQVEVHGRDIVADRME